MYNFSIKKSRFLLLIKLNFLCYDSISSLICLEGLYGLKFWTHGWRFKECDYFVDFFRFWSFEVQSECTCIKTEFHIDFNYNSWIKALKAKGIQFLWLCFLYLVQEFFSFSSIITLSFSDTISHTKLHLCGAWRGLTLTMNMTDKESGQNIQFLR